MTGLPDFNRAAFAAAAKVIADAGMTPVNPGALPEVPGWEHEDYMKRDLPMVASCDAVVLLEGWRMSPGARREFAHAIELAIPTADWCDLPMLVAALRAR